MGGFSIWHILILAVLVLLLFGGNRFSAMMGDVAKGLKLQQVSAMDKPAEQKHPAAAADRHYAVPPTDCTSDAARGRRSDAP
jgi:sec-independent protein translocase protein TatA